MLRIITALILLSVLWPITLIGPAWAFHLLVALAVSLATWECYGLMQARGARPLRAVGLAATLGVVWAFSEIRPGPEVSLPLALAALATPVLALWRRPEPAAMLRTSVSTLSPVLGIGLTLSFLSRIRAIPGEQGKDLVFLLIVCVILADTAAYYVGSRIGKHKLAPEISPGKTWEGAIAGLVGSIGGGLLAHVWFFRALPIVDAVILGLLLGVAGILGDLTESVLKRAARVKDSSSILPGHGGVLDRTDSLLFAAPVLYYYYTFVGFLGGSS